MLGIHHNNTILKKGILSASDPNHPRTVAKYAEFADHNHTLAETHYSEYAIFLHNQIRSLMYPFESAMLPGEKANIELLEEWGRFAIGTARKLRWFIDHDLSEMVTGFEEPVNTSLRDILENSVYHTFMEIRHVSAHPRPDANAHDDNTAWNWVALHTLYGTEALYQENPNFDTWKAKLDARELWLDATESVYPTYVQPVLKKYYTAPNAVEMTNNAEAWFHVARYMVDVPKGTLTLSTTTPVALSTTELSATLADTTLTGDPSREKWEWVGYKLKEGETEAPADATWTRVCVGKTCRVQVGDVGKVIKCRVWYRNGLSCDVAAVSAPTNAVTQR